MAFPGKYVHSIEGLEILAGIVPSYIEYVTLDSRQADEGALFVALVGEHTDGHSHALAAIAQGACAIMGSDKEALLALSEQCAHSETLIMCVPDVQNSLCALAAQWRAEYSGKVIGITGSVGKTSTKEMMVHVMSCQFVVSATKGNQNNELGVPLTLLNANPASHYVVVEMGMRGAGQIAELCAIVLPHIGVITAIGPSHIELLGSIEAIAQAKAELLQSLPSDGLAVFNGESEWAPLFTRLSPCKTLTVGTGGSAALKAHSAFTDEHGRVHAVITGLGHEFTVTMASPGVHQLLNGMLVAGVALHEGIAPEHLTHALAHSESSEGRFRIINLERSNITVIDDTYNANPLSMSVALETVGVLSATGKKIAVLGDMLELGTDAIALHSALGSTVCTNEISMLLTYGALARHIGSSAQEQCSLHWRSFNEYEFDVLQDVVLSEVQEGDVVLVKGSRGMRLERIVEALVNNDVN